tara:strand:- start:176 stop:1411 length:1236 start_codon:yes stop_codon:yes gene_type:complete
MLNKITQKQIDDLIFAEYNPRQLSDEQYKQLKDSISRFGLVDPIIVNKNKDRKGIIIGGHQRVKVAKTMGIDKVPCVEIDLTYDKERELNVRLNKNTGSWDFDVLANTFDIDELLDWGFDEKELQLDIFEEEKDGLIDDDAIPDDVESVCKLGDLWQLGEHRLLCGDSTKKENLELLLDGNKADMVFTDPPYGIGVSNKKGKILNDNDLDIYKKFIPLLNKYLEKNTHIYIFFGSKNTEMSLKILNKYYKQFNLLIFPITNQTQPYPEGYFSSNYEICYFTQYNGIKKHNGNILSVSDTTLKDNRYKGNGYLKKYYALNDNVITEHNLNTIHPTQKKVETISFYLKISSNNKNKVIDVFLGSGSTLIACEKTNRKCYGMELDEKYCDVIINRWEQFTGQKAELLNGKTKEI